LRGAYIELSEELIYRENRGFISSQMDALCGHREASSNSCGALESTNESLNAFIFTHPLQLGALGSQVDISCSSSVMSIRCSCFMKFACFCGVSNLVNPSATICPVGIQSILSLLACTSCLSQHECTSTCFNFVVSRGVSLLSSRIVC
jgi:hypothetical protein